MEKLIDQLKALAAKLQILITRLINLLFANLFYFLGVGISSLLSKPFGKQFLDWRRQGSSWQAAKSKIKLDRQF